MDGGGQSMDWTESGGPPPPLPPHHQHQHQHHRPDLPDHLAAHGTARFEEAEVAKTLLNLNSNAAPSNHLLHHPLFHQPPHQPHSQSHSQAGSKPASPRSSHPASPSSAVAAHLDAARRSVETQFPTPQELLPLMPLAKPPASAPSPAKPPSNHPPLIPTNGGQPPPSAGDAKGGGVPWHHLIPYLTTQPDGGSGPSNAAQRSATQHLPLHEAAPAAAPNHKPKPKAECKATSPIPPVSLPLPAPKLATPSPQPQPLPPTPTKNTPDPDKSGPSDIPGMSHPLRPHPLFHFEFSMDCRH